MVGHRKKKACIYRGIFTFSEILESDAKYSDEKTESVIVEIPLSMILGWRPNFLNNDQNSNDNDLIKVLSGIARNDGLQKSVTFIEVNGDNYPEGISKFERYGMEIGETFTVECPEPPFGFYSKHG